MDPFDFELLSSLKGFTLFLSYSPSDSREVKQVRCDLTQDLWRSTPSVTPLPGRGRGLSRWDGNTDFLENGRDWPPYPSRCTLGSRRWWRDVFPVTVPSHLTRGDEDTGDRESRGRTTRSWDKEDRVSFTSFYILTKTYHGEETDRG